MSDEPVFSDYDRIRYQLNVVQNDLLNIQESLTMFNSAMSLLLRLETQRQDKKSKNAKG